MQYLFQSFLFDKFLTYFIRFLFELDDYLIYLLRERIGSSITYKECESILSRLYEQEYVSEREMGIILAALKDAPIPISLELKDMIRAHDIK